MTIRKQFLLLSIDWRDGADVGSAQRALRDAVASVITPARATRYALDEPTRHADERIVELLNANSKLVLEKRDLRITKTASRMATVIASILIGAALTVAILGATSALIYLSLVPVHP